MKLLVFGDNSLAKISVTTYLGLRAWFITPYWFAVSVGENMEWEGWLIAGQHEWGSPGSSTTII